MNSRMMVVTSIDANHGRSSAATELSLRVEKSHARKLRVQKGPARSKGIL